MTRMNIAGQRHNGATHRWRAAMVVAVVAAIMVSGWSSAASAQTTTTVPSNAENFAPVFTAQAGPQGAALINELEGVASRLGLTQGSGQVTIADLERTNLPLVTNALEELSRAFRVGSYVAGLAFVGAILTTLQQHKDNPTQIVIEAPIAFLFVAAALIFAPSIFQSVGGTLFGPDDLVAGVEGIGALGEASLDHRTGRAADPLISASRVAALRTSLKGKGISGSALEAATQLTVLAAAVMVANAEH
jgi:hypothetical protein